MPFHDIPLSLIKIDYWFVIHREMHQVPQTHHRESISLIIVGFFEIPSEIRWLESVLTVCG